MIILNKYSISFKICYYQFHKYNKDLNNLQWHIDEELNNDVTNSSYVNIAGRNLRSTFSRRNFYNVIEGHFQNYGLNGTDCLLLMICELSESSILENNGLIGSLFHMLL